MQGAGQDMGSTMPRCKRARAQLPLCSTAAACRDTCAKTVVGPRGARDSRTLFTPSHHPEQPPALACTHPPFRYTTPHTTQAPLRKGNQRTMVQSGVGAQAKTFMCVRGCGYVSVGAPSCCARQWHTIAFFNAVAAALLAQAAVSLAAATPCGLSPFDLTRLNPALPAWARLAF